MTVQLSLSLGDKTELLLILLLVGHVFADFLVQTPRMAEEKETRTGPLLMHGFWTFITHLVFMVPFMSVLVVVGVAALALVHTAFDAIRIKAMGKWGGSLAAFFLDQSLHVLAVVALWVVLRNAGAYRHIVIPNVSVWLPPVKLLSVVAAGFVLNARGGTTVVRKLLQEFPNVGPKRVGEENDDYAMGRTIGCLERFLVFTLVLYGQWAALGLVVAAKSIARFKELESQTFSDYYLIGTLSSMLVAIATGILVAAVVF